MKVTPHVDGFQRQRDLHSRRDLELQRSPSADKTRRSASVSTSASSDTRAPFGRLISIAPRRALLRSRTGFVTADGGDVGGGVETALRSMSFTGTNAGAAPSCLKAATSAVFGGACRRSTSPRAHGVSIENEIGVQSIPVRNRRNSASSTIRWRSSRLHVRRRAPTSSESQALRRRSNRSSSRYVNSF